MHYQIDISSSKSYLDGSNREFESILNINIVTRLKYSIPKFWLDSNTRFQNPDSNWVLTSRKLDSTSMTRLDAISLHMKLLKKIHDQSFIFHFDNRRTTDLVQRFYYWSDHQVMIKCYIRNCHACQQSKAFRDSINKLLHSLSISQKRWKDIAMNFIIKLSLSKDYNIICTIICHLIKKRHYVLCHWKDESISVEETVWIMLWNVYQLHDLLNFIVSNRDSQFISTMWQSLCKWLRITTNLSTVYHSEINDQSEWVNQDVEHKLRIYCNYMQNDWTKWLFMMKFSENFNIFLIILMTSFYFNKSFYS